MSVVFAQGIEEDTRFSDSVEPSRTPLRRTVVSRSCSCYSLQSSQQEEPTYAIASLSVDYLHDHSGNHIAKSPHRHGKQIEDAPYIGEGGPVCMTKNDIHREDPPAHIGGEGESIEASRIVDMHNRSSLLGNTSTCSSTQSGANLETSTSDTKVEDPSAGEEKICVHTHKVSKSNTELLVDLIGRICIDTNVGPSKSKSREQRRPQAQHVKKTPLSEREEWSV